MTDESVAPVDAQQLSWWRRRALKKKRAQHKRALQKQAQAKRMRALRGLRAEIQDLLIAITDIKCGKAQPVEYVSYLETSTRDVAELLLASELELEEDVDAEGDEVRHLQNLWEQMRCVPLLGAPGASYGKEEIAAQCEHLEGLCRSMVVQISRLTIPEHLNRWLQGAWAGYLIPFHEVYGEELPFVEERDALLRRLACRPHLIEGGIVDAENGIIYPYHHEAWKRWGIILFLVVWFLGITAFAGGLIPHDSQAEGWLASLQSAVPTSGSLSGWSVLVLGVLVHDAIERGKRGGGTQPPSFSLGHVTYTIDARAGVLIMKTVSMLIAFFLVQVLGGVALNGANGRGGESNLFNMFLVGYSLDSFLGIFRSTLDSQAAARGAALSKQLEPAR